MYIILENNVINQTFRETGKSVCGGGGLGATVGHQGSGSITPYPIPMRQDV